MTANIRAKGREECTPNARQQKLFIFIQMNELEEDE